MDTYDPLFMYLRSNNISKSTLTAWASKINAVIEMHLVFSIGESRERSPSDFPSLIGILQLGGFNIWSKGRDDYTQDYQILVMATDI